MGISGKKFLGIWGSAHKTVYIRMISFIGMPFLISIRFFSLRGKALNRAAQIAKAVGAFLSLAFLQIFLSVLQTLQLVLFLCKLCLDLLLFGSELFKGFRFCRFSCSPFLKMGIKKTVNFSHIATSQRLVFRYSVCQASIGQLFLSGRKVITTPITPTMEKIKDHPKSKSKNGALPYPNINRMLTKIKAIPCSCSFIQSRSIFSEPFFKTPFIKDKNLVFLSVIHTEDCYRKNNPSPRHFVYFIQRQH